MKKLFNKGVYINTLKSLKYLAILMLFIGVLITLANTYNIDKDSYSYFTQPFVYNISYTGLVVVMFLGSVFMSFTAVKFAWSKKRADFEYANPVTKGQLFLSKAVGVITMQVTALLIIMLVGLYYSLEYLGTFAFASDMIVSFLYTVLGSLVIIGTIFFAISITGKPLSSIILSAGITLYPMLFLYIRTLAAIKFPYNEVVDIYKTPLYVLTGALLSIYEGWDFTRYLPGILVSSVFAVLLFSFGYILFKRRSGEISGTYTKNKLVHYIIMSIVPFAVAYYTVIKFWEFRLAAKIASTHMAKEQFLLSGDIDIIGALLVAVLILVFAYDIFVHKKFRKKNRCIWIFFIVVASAFFFNWATETSLKEKSEEKIDVEDVESISFVQGITFLNEYVIMDDYCYSQYVTSNFEIRDQKIIDEVVNNYNEQFLSGGHNGYYQTIKFNFKSGKSVNRGVPLEHRYNVDNQVIFDNAVTKVIKSEEYTDVFYAHVPLEYATYVSPETRGLTEDEEKKMMEIYKIFIDEYKQLSIEGKRLVTSNMRYTPYYLFSKLDDVNIIGSLNVKGRTGAVNTLDKYNVTDLTPKTYEAYKEIMEGINKRKGKKN